MTQVNSHRGEYVYVYNAARKPERLVRDREDLDRFIKVLHYLNAASTPRNWERDVSREHVQSGYVRPQHWEETQPLVSLISYQINENDFAMLVRAEQEQGVERYMQKVGTSIAAYYNTKYRHCGPIFEGSYRAAKVCKRTHVQYIAVAIEIQQPTVDLRYAAHAEQFNRAFEELTEMIIGGRYRMDDELIDVFLDTSY